MNLERFFTHHGLSENPFRAEEARHDSVFDRLIRSSQQHPDFEKVLGRVDRPSAAVVLGEKGSGKTAMRLQIAERVVRHNHESTDARTLLVAYDDFNPVLDRILARHSAAMGFRRAGKTPPEKMLEKIRLVDHQDAILSLAVTRLNDALLGVTTSDTGAVLPEDAQKRARKLPRSTRVDWALLSLLYDQPRSGGTAPRWAQIYDKLKLGWRAPMSVSRAGAIGFLVAAALLYGAGFLWKQDAAFLTIMAGVSLAGSLVMWGFWLFRQLRVWKLAKRILADVLSVDRTPGELRSMLFDMRAGDLVDRPWPGQASAATDNSDSRYRWTHRLLAVLRTMGYQGVMVLVDRVDEPQVVSGRADRMKPIVWPMLENKFLQQEGVGMKLLLPLELRPLLRRESADFFQGARLDKQAFVERLEWSGATLFDLCTARLRACSTGEKPAGEISLTSLFTQDVTRDLLVDALDQMKQPRDAFKFLYAVIQEHCRMVPEESEAFRVPRTVLESVRRQQANRLEEFHRGQSPA
ncbi:MAG: hypothetical protein GC164_11935 [Phycisphaera sp.]|nr:hypothetical protein [Phycisphaera sp.]